MQIDQTSKRLPWYSRKLIVNSNIQFVLLRYAVCMGLLFLSLGMFFAFTIEKVMTLRMGGFDFVTTSEIMMFSTLILFVIVACYLGLVVSNRIVGPIYRLVRHMEDFQVTGKFEEIHFRKDDHFKEIAISFNKIMARFAEFDIKK